MFETITAKHEHISVHVGDCAVCTQFVSAFEDACVVCVQICVACMCVCTCVLVHSYTGTHWAVLLIV